ncbi:MAG: hypothetical protein LM601_09640 [Candidatus Verstraetearchaeota archaeon]|jgi:uncharacterized membrane protein|nr:hypothetical protein [Candidatus Verstraetearchaeota archaeon]
MGDHEIFYFLSALLGQLTGYALFTLKSFWLAFTFFMFWLLLIYFELEGEEGGVKIEDASQLARVF